MSKVIFGNKPRKTAPNRTVRPPTEGGQATVFDCEASSSGDTSSASQTFIVPSSAGTGDLLIAWIRTGTSAGLSTPAGWTKEGEVIGGLGDTLIVFSKTAESGDAGSTVTATNDMSGEWVSACVAIRSPGSATVTLSGFGDGTTEVSAVTPSQGAGTYIVLEACGYRLSNNPNVDPSTNYTATCEALGGTGDFQMLVAERLVDITTSEDPDAMGTGPAGSGPQTVCVAIVATTDPELAAGVHTHIEADITDLAHTDSDAIHDNVAGEIAAITAKATPVSADFLVIEDSEASNAKKSITLGDLPGGASALDDLTDVTITGTPADNEVVAYDTGTAEFINQTAAEAGLSATGHTHTESDVTDLDHWVEADHDALDHTGLTGVGGAMVIFGAEPQSDGSLRFLYGVDASGRPTYTAAGTADTLAFVIQQSDGRYAVREV